MNDTIQYNELHKSKKTTFFLHGDFQPFLSEISNSETNIISLLFPKDLFLYLIDLTFVLCKGSKKLNQANACGHKIAITFEPIIQFGCQTLS